MKNDEHSPEEIGPRYYALGIVAVLVVLLAALITVPGVGIILVGWIPFLYRVLPAMEIDWPNLAVGAVATVLLAIGIQWFAHMWQRSRPGSSGRTWKLRWTLMVIATVYLLFASGLSIIGAFHQTAWLLSNEPPVFDEQVSWYGNGKHQIDQIAIAVADYTDTYKCLPPRHTFTSQGTMLHSWETDLFPFLGVAAQIDMSQPWYAPANEKHFKCINPFFINPDLSGAPFVDANGYGLSHYSANEHVIGGSESLRMSDLTDGAENTLLIGEVNAQFAAWGNPVNWRDPSIGINRLPSGFGGAPGQAGARFLNADASFRFVSERISPEVLRALSTPAAKDAPFAVD